MPTPTSNASPIWQTILTHARVLFQCGYAGSMWEAIHQVCEQHPELYQQHLAEELAAVGGTPAPVTKSRYLPTASPRPAPRSPHPWRRTEAVGRPPLARRRRF